MNNFEKHVEKRSKELRQRRKNYHKLMKEGYLCNKENAEKIEDIIERHKK